MKLIKLKIHGAFVIKMDLKKDFRGSFSRIFCSNALKRKKIDSSIKQMNISINNSAGNIRGFHYQVGKFAEIKRIMVLEGKIHDIIIDVRKNSKSYGEKVCLNLNSKNHEVLIVPKGVAHAYQTLTKNSKILYFNSNFYNKGFEKGISFNSKKFKIKWPLKPRAISKKDLLLSDYNCS